MAQISIAQVEPSDQDRFALRPLLAEFRDPQTEAAFRAQKLTADKRYATIVLITSLSIVITACFIDYYTFAKAQHGALVHALASRAVALALQSVCCVAVIRARSYRTLILAYLLLIVGSIIPYSYGVFIYVAHTPISVNKAVYVVLCATAPLLFPIPPRFTICGALITFLAAACNHLFFLGTPTSQVIFLLWVMLCCSAFSVCLAYAIQSARRREYAGMRRLAALTESLSDEVEKRRIVDRELQKHRDNLESLVKQRTDELHESERKLQVVQKLDSIGQLAGGVAHDFNNLLMVILGSTEMALEHPDLPPECRADLDEARRAALQGSQLSRQLLAFSSRQTIVPALLDVNEVVRGMENMLRRVVPENIAIRFEMEQGLEPVLADHGQLEQVLMNLIVNARDAVSDGGKISVATRSVRFDAQEAVRNPRAKPGHYVMLSVTDTGHGISKEHLSRIFEPFFTTKERGKGTGLGLAVVFGVVNQHGGFIDVYSEPNTGTEFRIYVPSANRDRVKLEEEEPACDLAGNERILLAEDDDKVRSVAHKILTKAGYTVHTVKDGRAAVREALEATAKFDLIVLDLVMPQMNGDQAFLQIRAQDPATPVIFCTGYSDVSINGELIAESGAAILQKPYTTKAMLTAVRKALDGHPTK